MEKRVLITSYQVSSKTGDSACLYSGWHGRLCINSSVANLILQGHKRWMAMTALMNAPLRA